MIWSSLEKEVKEFRGKVSGLGCGRRNQMDGSNLRSPRSTPGARDDDITPERR